MSIQLKNVSTANKSNCKNTSISAITVKNYLEPEMIKRLEYAFNDKESYINLMAGLWRARSGVNMLSEKNNRQNQIINEMFFALNDIIGCLLTNNIQLMNEIERRAGI
ncbi:hypothetical protein [Capnocytophaga sputigena]|uniref:hypothetical protein n=1 Tax=Capnocytophaga sputigena TaxID=1019 RepID=UPI00241D17AF